MTHRSGSSYQDIEEEKRRFDKDIDSLDDSNSGSKYFIAKQ